jgi:aminoglycoside phosphotransferase (APT) family kinase protein
VSAIDPTDAGELGRALLAHLRERFQNDALSFVEEPAAIGDGWETYIYGFQLAGAADAAWAVPLVLRLFPSVEMSSQAKREAAVQGFARERGVPTPTVLAADASGVALGLPWIVMERFAGRTVLELIAENPIKNRGLTPRVAELQASLHRVAVDGCPLPSDVTLAERQVEGFRARIEHFGLEGLEDEMAWLIGNASRVANEELALCHGDFHPNNVMVGDNGALCVIDWARAELGDRHHDLAATMLVMRAAPVQATSAMERFLDRFGRSMLERRFVGSYRKQLPIDKGRLRYWEALEALEWMLRVAMTEKIGRSGHLLRADSAERFPPGYGEKLRSMFWKYATG